MRRGEDIRKVIADAAQRRITVTKGCASGTDRGRGIIEETEKSGTRTAAIDLTNEDEEAVMLAYIDLIQEEEREKYGDAYVPPSNENPAGSQGTKSQATKSQASSPLPPSITSSTKPASPQPEPIDLTQPPSEWTCDICTLVNPSTYLVCDACGTEPPSPPCTPKPKPKPDSQANNHDPRSQSPQTGKPTPLTNKKSAVENIRILEAQAKKLPAKPMGWMCQRCGNWMEQEWWTCAACGSMKASS